MLLVKKTFIYLKKAFLLLLVPASVPAIALGMFGLPFSSLTFLPEYYGSETANVFYLLLSGKSLIHVYPLVLMLIGLVLACSYSLSIIEKHFKTGTLALRSPIRGVNNSILSVLKVLPIAIFVCIMLMLMQTGLVSLIRAIFSGTSGGRIADCIITSLISVLIYLIMVAVTVFMGVWAVIIQIFGFSFGDAFVESLRVVSKKWLAFCLGLIVPVTLMLIPQIVVSSLSLKWVVVAPVSVVTHALIFIYYSAYVMVSVYHLTGLERRDEKLLVPAKNGLYKG